MSFLEGIFLSRTISQFCFSEYPLLFIHFFISRTLQLKSIKNLGYLMNFLYIIKVNHLIIRWKHILWKFEKKYIGLTQIGDEKQSKTKQKSWRNKALIQTGCEGLKDENSKPLDSTKASPYLRFMQYESCYRCRRTFRVLF